MVLDLDLVLEFDLDMSLPLTIFSFVYTLTGIFCLTSLTGGSSTWLFLRS